MPASTRRTTVHNQPNNRPIHPECERLADSYSACTCSELWAGFVGTTESLREAIVTARGLEGRDIPQVLYGAALASAAPLDSLLTQHDSDEDMHSDTFWSRAEFLLTIDKPTD